MYLLEIEINIVGITGVMFYLQPHYLIQREIAQCPCLKQVPISKQILWNKAIQCFPKQILWDKNISILIKQTIYFEWEI